MSIFYTRRRLAKHFPSPTGSSANSWPARTNFVCGASRLASFRFQSTTTTTTTAVARTRRSRPSLASVTGTSHFISSQFDSFGCSYLAMSRQLKPLTFSRLEDLTLGSFALVPTSETINHLVRYLSTWSGTEYVSFASCATYSLMDTLIDSKLFMARTFALSYKCSSFSYCAYFLPCRLFSIH